MDAHEREANGAVAGMLDVYGTTAAPCRKLRDTVTFTRPASLEGQAAVGETAVGEIWGIQGDIYIVETGTELFEIRESDIVSL